MGRGSARLGSIEPRYGASRRGASFLCGGGREGSVIAVHRASKPARRLDGRRYGMAALAVDSMQAHARIRRDM